jgi:SAM-dependent methyltransferase
MTGAQIRRGDSILQSWRIRTTAPYIRPGAHVLDIGCGDGALFRALGGRIASGVGIDTSSVPPDRGSFRFIQGDAPQALPSGERYDAITLLAVMEHMPPTAQRDLAAACRALLQPRGRIVCTVPSPRADSLIHLGQRLGALDGIAEHEHYGFEPRDTIGVFAGSGFRLLRHRRFQLGLNHLFVFGRGDDASHSPIRS